MKGPKDKKYSGEHDEATSELRNYMKVQGVFDIQKFKTEVKQRQMQARIPKELLQTVIHDERKMESNLTNKGNMQEEGTIVENDQSLEV